MIRAEVERDERPTMEQLAAALERAERERDEARVELAELRARWVTGGREVVP